MNNSKELDNALIQAELAVQQGHFESALLQAKQIAQSYPKQNKAWYLQAVALRYLARIPEAIEANHQLLQCDQSYARAYQELGHCYRDIAKYAQAISNYQIAVKYNPALLSCWQNIGRLGDADVSSKALKQAEYWASLPRELLSINSMIFEKNWLKAERLCRHYLQTHPRDVEAIRLLAKIAQQLRIGDDAEFLLESAHILSPENPQVLYDYISTLHARQKYQLALVKAELLLSFDKTNPSFLSQYANQLQSVGRYAEAINVYDQVIAVLPDQAGAYLAKGHALKTKGDTELAIQSYEIAYQIQPDYGDAYWSLANLKTYQFSEAILESMKRLASIETIDNVDHYHICFALGKAFEDKQEYQNAFHYYQRGNSLKHDEVRYCQQDLEEEFEAQKRFFTADYFAHIDGSGCKVPDPIFIVGLPRAGSTLLEQIIASHSHVDGTMELPNILALASRLGGRRNAGEPNRYPNVLGELATSQYRQFGEEFIQNTKVHRAGAPYFIDKMPNNFRHIGLIKTILPNAKIIDARREPMACCFSGYKQLFAEGQEFSYSLDDIGHYYQRYISLMNHWQLVLPNQILLVQYENVVADLESQVRRILSYLELPFEQACLDFYSNKRAVKTASSEQVRQPINQSGIEQWKRFEPHLNVLTTRFKNNNNTDN